MDLPEIDIGSLDSWIEQLFECKQLTENNVKGLCAKASIAHAIADGGI